jgi:hypothetical protein
MAGYDPAANDGVDSESDDDLVIDDIEESAGTGIQSAGRSMIQITFDLNANSKIDYEERITYRFAGKDDADNDGMADAGAAPLHRVEGDHTFAGVAENIQALAFAYAFDNDHDGNLDTDDGTTEGNIIWAFDADPADGDSRLTWNLNSGLALPDPVPLADIRAVRFWILARTKAPVRGHFDSQTYTVGDRIISGADRYQRHLTRTTVYCRNMEL